MQWRRQWVNTASYTPIPLQQECNKNALRTVSVFPKFGRTTRQTYEPREILVRMYWDISENYRNAKRHYYDSSRNHMNSKQM